MNGEEPGGGAPLEASFEELFRTGYWPLVRSLSVAADREVVADCVADAFERAYARWGRISRYDEPIAWVRRVAVNRLRDHLRRAERGRRATDRLIAGVEGPPADPSALDIASVLAELPLQQRIAAALFYVDDLSVSAVAEAMAISEGAVKFHLHQARVRLRPILEPFVVEDEQ